MKEQNAVPTHSEHYLTNRICVCVCAQEYACMRGSKDARVKNSNFKIRTPPKAKTSSKDPNGRKETPRGFRKRNR